MCIVFFYCSFGRMKGITYYSSRSITVSLFFAFMVPAIFISMQLTGEFQIPQLGLGSAVLTGITLLRQIRWRVDQLGFEAYTFRRRKTECGYFLWSPWPWWWERLDCHMWLSVSLPSQEWKMPGFPLLCLSIYSISLYHAPCGSRSFGIYNTMNLQWKRWHYRFGWPNWQKTRPNHVDD